MSKIPISIIIDDPAPVLSVYYTHRGDKDFTDDGRPLAEYYPNELMAKFCDVVEKYGIKGKFSVVPMPGNRGDILNGIPGVKYELVTEWLYMVKKRLIPSFAVGPEMLTHHKAVDLATGEALEDNEKVWSMTQDRTTLTPYISKALEILKSVGITSCGVTSPWDFGIAVEDEYVAAISQAVHDVNGLDTAWYFLRGLRGVPNAKPWIASEENGRCVVSIPATTYDRFWQTINTTDQSKEYISSVADMLITEDGTSGEFVSALNNGAWPILITHWQSLMSNGLGTGIMALEETARRIEKNYGSQVEWKSFTEIMEYAAANRDEFPKRVFND
nr:hypothetical protein [Clostridia bacterium]